MAKLNLTLPNGELAVTGKQVTFTAPCDSAGLTHVIVQGIEFELVDSNGNNIVEGAFANGATVSIILNADNKKAYIQNADINYQLKESFDKKANVSPEIIDSKVSHIKTVPPSAFHTAKVKKVGGLTSRVTSSNNMFNVTTYHGYANATVKTDGGITIKGAGTSKYRFNGLEDGIGYTLLSKEPLPSGVSVEIRKYSDEYVFSESYGLDEPFTYYDSYGGTWDISLTITVASFAFEKEFTLYFQLYDSWKFDSAPPYEPPLYALVDSKVKNLMVVDNSEDPIIIDSLNIPEEVQSLDGYGVGKSETEFNYIDFEERLFHKIYERLRLRCVVDFTWYDSTNNWYAISGGTFSFADFDYENGFSPISREVLCSHLPFVDLETNSGEGICWSSDFRNVLVRKSGFTSEYQYDEWFSNNKVFIVDRLTTPIETDISHYDIDGSIEVIEGSTILLLKNDPEHIFPAQDDYVTIPSTIMFYEINNEVLGAKTFAGYLLGKASHAERDDKDNVISSTYALAPIVSNKDITAGSTHLAKGQSYHVYE